MKKKTIAERIIAFFGKLLMGLFVYPERITGSLKGVWKPIAELLLVVILFVIERQTSFLSVTVLLGVLMSLLICWAFSHLFAKWRVPMTTPVEVMTDVGKMHWNWGIIFFSGAFVCFLSAFLDGRGIPFSWKWCFCAIGIYLLLSGGATLLKAAYRNFRKDKEDSGIVFIPYAVAYVLIAGGCIQLALFLLGVAFPPLSSIYSLHVGIGFTLLGVVLFIALVFKEYLRQP